VTTANLVTVEDVGTQSRANEVWASNGDSSVCRRDSLAATVSIMTSLGGQSSYR
jgi:hypothetical protein